MRKENEIDKNPRKNTPAKKEKKQITINIDFDTIDYFKDESIRVGIPYQVLMNLYLSECVKKNRKIDIDWK